MKNICKINAVKGFSEKPNLYLRRCLVYGFRIEQMIC
jgi:hypothetical protein